MTQKPDPSPDDVPASLPDVAALPAETQLATALVIQSQALEGMRAAQSDLLRRIDGSSAARDLRQAVGDIESAAEQVRRAQDDAVSALSSSRRRIVGWVAAVGALVVVVVGWGVWWIDGRLDEQFPTGVESVRAERDSLAGELEVAQLSVAELEAALAEERDRHQAALGELARVRTDYVASRTAVADIRETLADLPVAAPTAASAPDASTIQVVEGGGEPTLPTRLNAALSADGAAELRIVEAGELRDGTLHDLLFIDVDPRTGAPLGPAARADEASLAVAHGRVALRLVGGDLVDGTRRVELPRFEEARWAALGLEPRGGAVLGDVLDALGALVEIRGYRVVQLGGVSAGGLLTDVVLKEEGPRGEVVRMLRAPRARLEESGPQLVDLVLEGGTVTVGDDERPFFRDVFRLGIPGADLRPLRAAFGRADS